MSTEKKILILTLGGTILSEYDPNLKRVVPVFDAEELVKPLLDRREGVELEVAEFAKKPGPHLTPAIGIELAEELRRREDRYDGFVVIQGTDTLEEFPYLLSLIVNPLKPIVFTGSMKSKNELYSDRMGNAANAIEVACAAKSSGRGVLVAMNENIFDPRFVLKMHTSNIDSFQAPETGPIGTVHQGEVSYFYEPRAARPLQSAFDPRVEVVKATMGGSPFLLEACIEAGMRGVIIEALGAGNVPDTWEPSVEKAIRKGMFIVVTSRSPQGSAAPLYDYAGGGKSLEKFGVLFAKRISAAKARIKLMLLLGQSPRLGEAEIRAAWEENL